MTKDSVLVPVEQKQVVFYEDMLTAVLVEEGDGRTIYIPLRPICDFLGLAWSPQLRRINRDPVLSAEVRTVSVVSPLGGRQETTCLPLDYISGFLFGINATRAKEAVQERLIRYQRECYKVLADAFQEGRLTGGPALSDLLESDSPAAQAYKMVQAMLEMARNQLLLESRLDTHGERLEQHERRLEEVESILGNPDHLITPQQASQISQAVKAVALVMTKRSGSNQYGSVYGELYRRFDITGYKLLPKKRFAEAMDFLNNWYQSLVDDSTPF